MLRHATWKCSRAHLLDCLALLYPDQPPCLGSALTIESSLSRQEPQFRFALLYDPPPNPCILSTCSLTHPDLHRSHTCWRTP